LARGEADLEEVAAPVGLRLHLAIHALRLEQDDGAFDRLALGVNDLATDDALRQC
jgi:hypothetical protein